jgi:hypothetical protein
MKIAALEKYRGRNPKGSFENLPWEVRNRAHQWLYKLASKWGRNLPAWRFAILVGQAKRLALNPPTSAWGRSMLAKRGGLAVQRKYRQEGSNPTQRATQVRLAKQRRCKATGQSPESRPNKVMYLPLWD